jgi:hypothetical protein
MADAVSRLETPCEQNRNPDLLADGLGVGGSQTLQPVEIDLTAGVPEGLRPPPQPLDNPSEVSKTKEVAKRPSSAIDEALVSPVSVLPAFESPHAVFYRPISVMARQPSPYKVG